MAGGGGWAAVSRAARSLCWGRHMGARQLSARWMCRRRGTERPPLSAGGAPRACWGSLRCGEAARPRLAPCQRHRAAAKCLSSSFPENGGCRGCAGAQGVGSGGPGPVCQGAPVWRHAFLSPRPHHRGSEGEVGHGRPGVPPLSGVLQPYGMEWGPRSGRWKGPLGRPHLGSRGAQSRGVLGHRRRGGALSCSPSPPGAAASQGLEPSLGVGWPGPGVQTSWRGPLRMRSQKGYAAHSRQPRARLLRGP